MLSNPVLHVLQHSSRTFIRFSEFNWSLIV
ncbi:hypothetical protein ALQ22_200264 [Pseudomonas savastanoi pv. retacarpa]|nr:hypothetical protein ALQ22_200264 [Pseudomonas savastanoi pv. retacarpa]